MVYTFVKIAVFHTLPVGGARRAVNEISLALKKQHTVDLYFIDEKENKKEEKNFSKNHYYEFVARKWSGGDWKTRIYKDTIELFKIYFLEKKIAYDINKKNYDLVLVSASKFVETPFILRFVKSKKVFYCHDPYYRLIYEPEFTFPKHLNLLEFSYEKLNRFIRKILDWQNFQNIDFILANSAFTKNKVYEIYKRDSKVAYLGVDSNFFSPNNKITNDIDILYLGSREEIDGYSLLEEAISYMKIKPKVKKIFIEEGFISNDKELLDLYRRSKIVVGFSHNEPLGLVPLEAMACGDVVLAVSEGGYKETITDGKTGFLLNRDPREIAQKIDYLLNNHTLRDLIGINARKSILKNWTWEKSAKKIEKLLLQFIKKK